MGSAFRQPSTFSTGGLKQQLVVVKVSCESSSATVKCPTCSLPTVCSARLEACHHLVGLCCLAAIQERNECPLCAAPATKATMVHPNQALFRCHISDCRKAFYNLPSLQHHGAEEHGTDFTWEAPPTPLELRVDQVQHHQGDGGRIQTKGRPSITTTPDEVLEAEENLEPENTTIAEENRETEGSHKLDETTEPEGSSHMAPIPVPIPEEKSEGSHPTVDMPTQPSEYSTDSPIVNPPLSSTSAGLLGDEELLEGLF